MSALWNLQLRNPENGCESQHFRVQVRHLGGGSHWAECESILEEPQGAKGCMGQKQRVSLCSSPSSATYQ